MEMDRKFQIGQIVSLRADPSRKGPVINILPPVGEVDRYQVYHSPTEIREYRADQIVLVDISPASDPLRDAIAQNDWRQPEEFWLA